jgi:ATP-dependent exoDNAse (exonuclease V) alpha subunit
MDIIKEKNNQSKKIVLTLPKYPFSKISQKVYLTLETPIISIKNKKDVDIVNGEMFKVNDIDKENNLIYISNNYKTNIKIPFNKFQQWFHVAYCITSHKSQGQTINKPYTIHDWNLMDETCKYVSLSRSSEYEYVNII